MGDMIDFGSQRSKRFVDTYEVRNKSVDMYSLSDLTGTGSTVVREVVRCEGT